MKDKLTLKDEQLKETESMKSDLRSQLKEKEKEVELLNIEIKKQLIIFTD